MRKTKEFNEDIEIIVQSFNDLAECSDYFNAEFAKLNSMYSQDIFSKREFKNFKKFLRKQYWANLQLLKKKEDTNIEREKNALKLAKKQSSEVKEIKPITTVTDLKYSQLADPEEPAQIEYKNDGGEYGA